MDAFEANDVQKKVGWHGKLHTTTDYIWNSSRREFMGRTASSWAKIGLFYLVFYASLAAFFAIMLAGFFRTLDNKAPTQQNMYSLMKSNPGMGFRPMPNIESTLIRFKQGLKEEYKVYTDHIDNYLEELYNQSEAKTVNCTGVRVGTDLAEGEVCKVGRTMFGNECVSEKDYSYDEGMPCVLLKINKVYGWIPEPFTEAALNDSSNTHAQEAKQKLGDRLDEDYVGITCEGENEADADSMGNVTYYPRLGFPSAFYPYKNQDNYRPPIVFVRFNNPKYGVLIQVWCRLWSANIKHHKNDKAGSIHFELLVD